MKKVYWSLILIFHVNFLFAQLNIVDKTAITQQTQQGNLQVLGKPDFNIDKYFIPYDKIVWRKPSHDFKPNENVTGMKLYVKSEEKEINLCINHNDSTITLKSIPEGYYEISGIIRFRENFNFHMNAFANYKFVENDSLFTSIEEYFECWKKEYLFSSFSLESAADFEKKVLVDKGKYSSNPIYVLSNGKGEDFYIDSNLEYFTRRSIKKAYYEIKKITRGKKVIRVDTIQHSDPNFSYWVCSIRALSYKSISMPFYEKLCSDIKGHEVLLMFANEYFTDYSGFILKSPYIYPSGIYDEDKFEYIVKLDHGNGFAVDFYYTENSFPDLKWAMCLDIYVENSKIYGLFEYENSRFVLEINALDDEWKATIPPTTKIPYLDRSSFRYYVMSYVGANNSYRIITREEIEKTRKNLLQNLKDYKIGQQKAELLQKKRLAAEEEEYKRKQLQRKSMLIDKYGEEFGTAISENKVMVGMSEEMCRAAWGTPYDRFNKMTWWGNTSVWVYNYKTYLYFRDGKLKEIYK